MLPRFRELVPPSGPHSARQFNNWCDEADLGAWLDLLPASACTDFGTSLQAFVLYEHVGNEERVSESTSGRLQQSLA